ncbi:MAG: pantetheine-phosphate adenylyltransferase [Deltaproteobacteria bacterium]|nr:pantetheine-phosphate adenylyltransferase [Deltaproteobacteria bacterium]
MAKGITAVFPGSFDPLTNGHVDIVTRSLKIFDRVVVAVLSNPQKATLFTVDERVQLIQEELCSRFEGVSVQSFSGLLVDFVQKAQAKIIIRGLRAISDYDYETQMALMNRNLSEDVETCFLITSEENSYISSSIVKQVATFGGNVSKFVPDRVQKALKTKVATK